MWDVFISHAAEDKDAVARPLASALADRRITSWFDETELLPGDSLLESIDHGLAMSRFGVIVLSPSFFSKEWPREELRGLRTRQLAGERILLPVWHEVTPADVREFSLPLADLVAVPTYIGIDAVADRLMARIGRGSAPVAVDFTRTPALPEHYLRLTSPRGYSEFQRKLAQVTHSAHDATAGCLFVRFGLYETDTRRRSLNYDGAPIVTTMATLLDRHLDCRIASICPAPNTVAFLLDNLESPWDLIHLTHDVSDLLRFDPSDKGLATEYAQLQSAVLTVLLAARDVEIADLLRYAFQTEHLEQRESGSSYSVYGGLSRT